MKVLIKRFKSLILYSDTTPTRFFLAMVTTLWAAGLLVPGDTFDRKVYFYMKLIVGEENAEMKWAFLWTVLSVAQWWRIFTSVSRPYVALAINSFSLAMFSACCFSIIFSQMRPFPAAMAPDMACMMAALWILIRTGVKSESGWRND